MGHYTQKETRNSFRILVGKLMGEITSKWLRGMVKLKWLHQDRNRFKDLSELRRSHSRSWWSRGLRRGPAAALLLGLRVRIPSGAGMSVCCEC